MDKGNGASDAGAPVYHKFVNIAQNMHPLFVSMIMPSKWMVGGRAELLDFREKMKDDNRIMYIKDYRNDRSIFPTAHNDGGICYFLWNRKYKCNKIQYTYVTMDGESYSNNILLKNDFTYLIIRDIRVMPILEKIHESYAKKDTFSKIVSKTRPFGLRKDVFNNPAKYVKSKLQFSSFPQSLRLYGVQGTKGGAKRIVGYITDSEVQDKYDAIDKYKIFFTTTYSSDAVRPPEYIKGYKRDICTETFLLIGPFNTEAEMENCASFMDTNFFRFLLYLGHGTMQVNQNVFSLIPLLDFDDKSEIDWSKSVSSIDLQLYDKFGLSDSEINFIDQIMKPTE
jgi:hypothetical protein